MKISILGDSISTYEGYSPSKAVFFDRYNSYETGIETVEDTWWMQVIRALDGELGFNDSLAGSTVFGGMSSSGTSYDRIRALGRGGEPDCILVFMGSNDWAYGVLPDQFQQAYGLMLDRLKETWPEAEIWCGTIPSGKMVDPAESFFFNMDGLISPRVYSDIIRKLADSRNIHIVDLAKDNREYETIDGVHPDKDGMKTLAGLWLSGIKEAGSCSGSTAGEV